VTEIIYTSEVHADLIQHVGGDAMIANAARVSTGQVGEYDDAKDAGLIRYLMRKKHGSPFEHNSMTFLVEAPIFVAREFMRHRAGFSYNETSGRYSVLEPRFYVPAEDRPLVNVGSSANPKFEAGSERQVITTRATLKASYEDSWLDYKSLIGQGIGNEVARMALPLGIMTSFYVTCNARSLMAFLALRTSDAGVSNPQHEIELVAKKLEEQFAILFSKTYASFNEFGRVAP
jgi:thymidylate synthase (FAD)